MTAAKRKRPPREGEGRPARTSDGASSNFVLRLSGSERDTLRSLAERLGCSEAEAARTAIRESVHERFHETTEPGCDLCAEYERKTNAAMDAIQAQAPAISAAITDVVKRGAAKLRKRKAKRG